MKNFIWVLLLMPTVLGAQSWAECDVLRKRVEDACQKTRCGSSAERNVDACYKAVKLSRRPADTLFRPEVVKNMIKVVGAFNSSAGRDLYRAHPRLYGYFTDFFWEYQWCAYRNLSSKEVREMFDLRLANFPALRKEADRKLGRSVAKQGFGFYLDPWLVNDYAGSDKMFQQADVVFSKYLKQHGLTPCKRYWED